MELKPVGGMLARWVAAMANMRHLVAMIRPVLIERKIAPEIARTRALRRYLENRQPDVLLSALTYANLIAVWAKNAIEPKTPVVVSERIALSIHCTTPSNRRKWRWRYLPDLVSRTYAGANAVAAVSNQVADDLSAAVGLDRQSIATIYNPVADEHIRTRAQELLEHEWFAPDNPPVILGAGRLAQQKDFLMLIRAFAQLRAGREMRLIITGEGKQRAQLERLAEELGVRDDVELPGFVDNPFQYMARASVFVLSSE